MKAFFKFFIEILAKKRNIFKRIARREYGSKCNVLYINGFVLTSSTNQWKSFFKFRNNFSNHLQFKKKNSGIGYVCMRGGEAFVLISTHSSYLFGDNENI